MSYASAVFMAGVGSIIGAVITIAIQDSSCAHQLSPSTNASYYLSLPDALTAHEAYRRVVSQSAEDDFCIVPTNDGRWAGYLCNPLEDTP